MVSTPVPLEARHTASYSPRLWTSFVVDLTANVGQLFRNMSRSTRYEIKGDNWAPGRTMLAWPVPGSNWI
jgi:hypothetical protein